jgi:hypothetical protein
MLDLKARDGGCEEAALLPPGLDFYAPCNKPAVSIVGWKGRSDPPIRRFACAKCAHGTMSRIAAATYIVKKIHNAP